MKVTKELADETPVCACWWVMCPNCLRALGQPHPYPKKAYMASLCKK